MNKQKSNKIKRKLIYNQAHVNGTDPHISGSSCDLISPACRTINNEHSNFSLPLSQLPHFHFDKMDAISQMHFRQRKFVYFD